MNLTVLTGDQVELKVFQDDAGDVNQDENAYFAALTGTWLRT